LVAKRKNPIHIIANIIIPTPADVVSSQTISPNKSPSSYLKVPVENNITNEITHQIKKIKKHKTKIIGTSRLLYLSFTKSEAIEINLAANLIEDNKHKTSNKNIPAKTQEIIAHVLKAWASSSFKELSAII